MSCIDVNATVRFFESKAAKPVQKTHIRVLVDADGSSAQLQTAVDPMKRGVIAIVTVTVESVGTREQRFVMIIAPRQLFVLPSSTYVELLRVVPVWLKLSERPLAVGTPSGTGRDKKSLSLILDALSGAQ